MILELEKLPPIFKIIFVAEWLKRPLAEQEVEGSILGSAVIISD